MTAFVIKIIALTTMLIDHLGAVFPGYFPFEFRVIGRLAFPLFVFFIAEGCRHTKSMPKFLWRLFLFALISEIPFDMAIKQGEIHFLDFTNIFYTLLLGVAAVYAYQQLHKLKPAYALYLSVLPLFAAMWLANWISTDYSAYGVAFIFTMYVIPHKKLRLAAMAVFCCLSQIDFLVMAAANWLGFPQYGGYINPVYVALITACLLTVPLVALYNGRRGPSLKWFFYIFYPAHLTVLVIVSMFI